MKKKSMKGMKNTFCNGDWETVLIGEVSPKNKVTHDSTDCENVTKYVESEAKLMDEKLTNPRKIMMMNVRYTSIGGMAKEMVN
eukprot:CAMPEP_0204436682 /NCGR_PEP_ID=MMETSP0470-20130426/75980_1 /ASSEMBLY_ACC=CAM_ASM_000385 /TAXON_ID=2969 /ORGANISM="Oxyrrhis marina" /LENGTH=82 /DNA_ID=CAMNT_0051435353 /DNA_START=242 /DNA_END=490 /DNA_ORIENTATION=-